MLTAAVAIASTSSATAQVNCNLKEDMFRTFAPTSVTIPPDGTGTPAVAHAVMLGWVRVEAGENKTITVECFGPADTQLFSATMTALKVGVLTIQ